MRITRLVGPVFVHQGLWVYTHETRVLRPVVCLCVLFVLVLSVGSPHSPHWVREGGPKGKVTAWV